MASARYVFRGKLHLPPHQRPKSYRLKLALGALVAVAMVGVLIKLYSTVLEFRAANQDYDPMFSLLVVGAIVGLGAVLGWLNYERQRFRGNVRFTETGLFVQVGRRPEVAYVVRRLSSIALEAEKPKRIIVARPRLLLPSRTMPSSWQFAPSIGTLRITELAKPLQTIEIQFYVNDTRSYNLLLKLLELWRRNGARAWLVGPPKPEGYNTVATVAE